MPEFRDQQNVQSVFPPWASNSRKGALSAQISLLILSLPRQPALYGIPRPLRTT